MSEASPTIDILCKVVDNFGDIGVVYRLARALSEAEPEARLRLVVDDLAAFHALEPAVDPGAPLQEVRGWTLCRWDSPAPAFSREPPRLVLECFACGRPDWFEALLFDERRAERRLIVDLEYLSAEDWADDFHLIPSLTRSPSVAKVLFMPGFSPKTGGLILDRDFLAARSRLSPGPGRLEARRDIAALLTKRRADVDPGAGALPPEDFWVSVFGYERDYGPIVADLAAFHQKRPLAALVAAGKSSPCFLSAWEKLGRPFPALALPFLPQTAWDELLLAADFAIVRGEDSLSRAALSGRPFLWQAYPQAEKQQLVKVRALLERLKANFAPGDFSPLEALFLAFNDRLADSPDRRGAEALLPVLERYEALEPGFRAFSSALLAQGNLVAPLLTFLRDFR